MKDCSILASILSSNIEIDAYNIFIGNNTHHLSDEKLVKYIIIFTKNINLMEHLIEQNSSLEFLHINDNISIDINDFLKKSYKIRNIVQKEIINRQLNIGRHRRTTNTDFSEMYEKFATDFENNGFHFS